jgi:glucosamine-6-phosphate deaminase
LNQVPQRSLRKRPQTFSQPTRHAHPLSRRNLRESSDRRFFLIPPRRPEPLAQEVKQLIEAKNKAGKPAVLGMATGSTPVPFYRELIRLHKEEGLSFKNVITFNLDEYYGLSGDHPESYARFMAEQLFDHIDIPKANINLPSGTVPGDQVFNALPAV